MKKITIVFALLMGILAFYAFKSPSYPDHVPKNIGEEISYMIFMDKAVKRCAKKYHIRYDVLMANTLLAKKKIEKSSNYETWVKTFVTRNKGLITTHAPLYKWCESDPRICSIIQTYNLSVSNENL